MIMTTLDRRRMFVPLLGLLLALGVGLALSQLAQLGRIDASSGALIQEEPERGSTVAEAPHQLLLTFDRPLAQLIGAHRVAVTDSYGDRVDDGHPLISNYSQRTLVVPINMHGDGQLTVEYRVQLIGDGEMLQFESSYAFSVDHTLGPNEGEDISAPATAKSSQPIVLWTIAILIGISAVGAMLYFLRLATGTSRSSLEPVNRSVFRDDR